MIAGRPVPGELEEPPEHLPDDAKDFWRVTVPRLVSAGIVDRVDIPALIALATQYDVMVKARRVIAQKGLFARGSTGQIVEHPAVKIERNAAKAFQSLSEQFGITPVARVRLGKAELERQSLDQALKEVIPGQTGELQPVDTIDGTAEELP